MNPHYALVEQRAAHQCEYCRAPEALLTAIGRATIARLQMNSPAQLAARQQWVRLRLFPPA